MMRRPLSLSALLLLITALRLVSQPIAKANTPTSTEVTQVAAAQRQLENPTDQKKEAGTGGGARERENGRSEPVDAGMILNYATFLVTVVTAVFGIFVAAFSIFDWLRFRSVRRELTAQRTKLERERLDLQVRMEAFTSGLQAQEKRLAANQRHLEAVLSHHSDLLVGITEGFGAALKPEDAEKLRSLIFEADAVLDLFHPDVAEVSKALLLLEQIGADGSISPLVELRKDPNADADIRVRAQEVLSTVTERLKKRQR